MIEKDSFSKYIEKLLFALSNTVSKNDTLTNLLTGLLKKASAERDELRKFVEELGGRWDAGECSKLVGEGSLAEHIKHNLAYASAKARAAVEEKPKHGLTGDRLTEEKARQIAAHGCKYSGYILQADRGDRVLVEMSAVRVLNQNEMWELMHPMPITYEGPTEPLVATEKYTAVGTMFTTDTGNPFPVEYGDLHKRWTDRGMNGKTIYVKEENGNA